MNKKFDIQYTNAFKKQYKKMEKKSNFKKEEFKKVIYILSNNRLLPEKYNNHLLNPKSNRYLGMSYTAQYFIRI